ncbi:helix-turn-helix domain-containing protein [Lactococcus lactis]|uniref:helix-turn-helix domain-containing protein n=1 Tax=Lactococcus lactis TaxID=1358 RepID=UPI0021A94B83|nr:helix-turn-helix transcriptional regulator [Lactococcus lactis]MCT0052095.1 XRE family transcriptional regulator [Lactococcus lactis subsp. lactis]
MDLYEKIKELAAQKHTSIRKIEERLGYGNGTIRRWNKNKPNYDKIQAVAKYFNVSVDYLLGNDDEEPELPKLTVEQILDSVENYSGGELTESDREMLRIIIEAKKAAVEKESKNKG